MSLSPFPSHFFVHPLNASKMESESVGVGFMAVIAVTGSVVFIAHEVHKRLLSDFMKKIEIELGDKEKREGVEEGQLVHSMIENWKGRGTQIEKGQNIMY
ncbi:hypothetical protein Gogos_009282 [Gossypium gossypioides]|uniref:Uncharacterized protein n=1 Tax=Gossypium gossypioides TaxID=34282 RepID=A0A7J9CER0_GOSGO|nr:hypothetical protein [Gossypium gossypioides]